MSGPRISIAMATYNGARFIHEQLESFAAQTLLPDELVITDDGSTDSTLEIAESFARSAPFAVRIHRNPARLGFSRNFETAIARCEGDLIFLSDQDDVWLADKLAAVREVFDADPGIMAVLNGQIIADSALSHRGVTMLENARAFGMGPDRLVSGCATALRRSWARVLLPMPAEADDFFEGGFLAYDRWINELSVLLGVRAFVERPLQYFRRYGDNTSQSVQHDPDGVGLRVLVSTRERRAPADAWLKRASLLDLYEHWLADHRYALEGLGIASTPEAIQRVDRERRSLRARADLARQSFPARLRSVAALWLGGGYRYFHGWKSALRDVVRTG